MPTILDKIVATKRLEIAVAQKRGPVTERRGQRSGPPPSGALRAAIAALGPLELIAEGKKARPSVGLIREDSDPVAIARICEQHGAACLSVLTDEQYLQG